jgi:hypothetical protein
MIAGLERQEKEGKRAQLLRIRPRVPAAVAACVALGSLLSLAAWYSMRSMVPLTEHAQALGGALAIVELASGAGDIEVPIGVKVRTAPAELKTLAINDKHRILMNVDTVLSVEPLTDGGFPGYLVNLHEGEIFACVEPDRGQFVVRTSHGQVVVAGTIFDIKVTNACTTLVVAEGGVRFGSKRGTVEVPAGHVSEISGQFPPSEPQMCDTSKLTAWATCHKVGTASTAALAIPDISDHSDVWMTAISGPTDLESIEYRNWVEEKRDWFSREFPWIFELKTALAQEGIEIDYPELLVKSGDIWQFLYPRLAGERIPALNFDSLTETVSHYGFDRQWLVESVRLTISEIDDSTATGGRPTVLEAMQKWIDCLENALKSHEELDPAALLRSLHASTYLANTRTLLWFSVKRRELTLRPKDRAEVLALLQAEVDAANNVATEVIRLLWVCRIWSCTPYRKSVQKVMQNLKAVMNAEERIASYENSR